MTNNSANTRSPLKEGDLKELTKLTNAVALSDGALALFAIAPESGPDHPVVEEFKAQLRDLGESWEFLTLHYSEESLFNFLQRLDRNSSDRRVVMAFGLEQLPLPFLRSEMEQLNIGRERIFERNLVLVFWLNREAFLNEFRSQAADFWDWRGNIAKFATRPPVDPLLYPYLEWLIAENSRLKVAGVFQVNRQVDILLDRIYVSLQGEWVEEQSSSFREGFMPRSGRFSMQMGIPDFDGEMFLPDMDSEPVNRQRVTRMADLAETVRKRTYSAILGDPGAGKTTLLRYLARHFAIAHRDKKARVTGGQGEDLGEIRLPILLRIADFAERIAKQKDLTLEEYIKQFYRIPPSPPLKGGERGNREGDSLKEGERGNGAGDEAIASLLLRKMAAGDCLLLLDGLDEVFDRANRVQVVREIDRLVEKYHNNKFVVTSRIAGYQEASLGDRFREFTIVPMKEEQIEDFLQRWCLAIEEAQRPDVDASLRQRDAEREARGIVNAIASQAGVKRLATNPLLLTILALIHRNGTRLPQRRIELYELAAKTLIEDWQLGRNVPYGTQQKQPDLLEEEVTALLAPLAFWIHEEKPSGMVEQEEVEAFLMPKMVELQGIDKSFALERVRLFLRKVRETTGLLVERAPGVYGFMHLTFEEYFTARYIADNKINDILEIIESKLSDPRWEEPIFLALSFLNHRVPQQSKNLIESLLTDLIKLGDEMQSNQKSYPLNSIKFNGLNLKSNIRKKSVFKALFYFVEPVFRLLSYISSFLASSQTVRYMFKISQYPNYYLGKRNLAFSIVQDLNLNILQRNKIIQGLFSEKLIIHAFANANADLYIFYSRFPSNIGAKLEEILQSIKKMDILETEFFEKVGYSREENLTNDFVLDHLKLISSNLLSPQLVRDNAQQLFFKIISDPSNCSDENSIYIIKSLIEMLPNEYKALAYQNAGYAFQERSRYQKAIFYYRKSIELYEYFGLNRNAAFSWFLINSCYRESRNYEKAIEVGQKSLSCFHLLKDENKIALSYQQLGYTYQSWKKYEEAISSYLQFFNISEKSNNLEYLVLSQLLISRCYMEWKKYKEAEVSGIKSLILLQQLKNKRVTFLGNYNWWIFEINCLLGKIYQFWGKYKESIDYYQKGYALLKDENTVSTFIQYLPQAIRQSHEINSFVSINQLGNLIQEIDSLDSKKRSLLISSVPNRMMAEVYRVWNKYNKAIQYHLDTLQIYEQIDLKRNVSEQYILLSQCYRDWGQYKKAVEYAKKSFELCLEFELSLFIDSPILILGRIYQEWGKYEKALLFYERCRALCQQQNQEKNIADLFYYTAVCYCEWGNYEAALIAEQQDLAIREKLDDQLNIADAYYRLGRIHQEWRKYEDAITHHKKSLELYESLDLQEDVANKLSWLADCYQDLKNYNTAIEYRKQSLDRHQKIGNNKKIARQLRKLSNTQRKQAQNLPQEETLSLLQKAMQNLQQAMQLDTENDYRKNLAYDRISQALLIAESLRWDSKEDSSKTDRIAEFEQLYTTGFEYFTELGQEVDRAVEALEIARAYIEIEALENCDRAEELAQQSLQTFQEFNRRKRQAATYKLLGEIALKRASKGETEAIATAEHYLSESLQLYRDLTIDPKIEEVEKLLAKTRESS
jgi:tetratricopeptide (TPR) repeat protein